MKCSVDRTGEGIAVLVLQDDPRQRITVPVDLLPSGSGQGDVLVLTIEADPMATGAAFKRVSGLIEKLKKNRLC